MDKEAKDSWFHLGKLKEDIMNKTQKYKSRIFGDYSRLRDQHHHQDDIYNIYD